MSDHHDCAFSRIAQVQVDARVRDGAGKGRGRMTLDEDHPGMFHAAIEMSLVPIVLADPHQHDCPIVFANGAFCEMTGYDLAEIVGRNCRFLQGPATDRQAVARIRDAISARWHCTEELLNYRKDGTPFWNALFINPVFDQGGRLVFLFGTQLNVTRRRALEDALQQSHELLPVMQAHLAAALALPMSDAQRQHLQRVAWAIDQSAHHQRPLLSNVAASGEPS